MKYQNLMFIICVEMLLVACTAGDGFKTADMASTPKIVEVTFNASKEASVKTRGGYKVYVGAAAGFSVGSAIKVIDVLGSSESSGKIQVSITSLPSGNYYLKTRAYSDLVDPNIGTAAVSALSDEVAFNVP